MIAYNFLPPQALMEESFGRVAFAKLVMDREMGHPRGTAFVKFLRKEYALKVIVLPSNPDHVTKDLIWSCDQPNPHTQAIHEASPEGEKGIFLDGR